EAEPSSSPPSPCLPSVPIRLFSLPSPSLCRSRCTSSLMRMDEGAASSSHGRERGPSLWLAPMDSFPIASPLLFRFRSVTRTSSSPMDLRWLGSFYVGSDLSLA
uniref:Uncharacterized protein n=1 Tax=Triticum urartu TaxID=4572 RepID=A0A8R7UTW9_TRIUA